MSMKIWTSAMNSTTLRLFYQMITLKISGRTQNFASRLHATAQKGTKRTTPGLFIVFVRSVLTVCSVLIARPCLTLMGAQKRLDGNSSKRWTWVFWQWVFSKDPDLDSSKNTLLLENPSRDRYVPDGQCPQVGPTRWSSHWPGLPPAISLIFVLPYSWKLEMS